MKKFVLAMTAAALMCSASVSAQNRVKNVYTESQTLKVEQLANTSQTVQVNRYLFAGYNTLCLPMTMDATQLASFQVKVERLAAIGQEGNTLCLYFVDCSNEGIEAGVPYLIYSPVKQYLRLKNTDATAFSADVQTIRLTDEKGNQVSFTSSWDKRQKDGCYGIPAKQDVEILESVLVRTTADLAFLPTRCGFNWEQQAEGADNLEIRHISAAEVTSLREMRNDKFGTDNGEAYNLAGQRVGNAAKGITIVNGKKVVK